MTTIYTSMVGPSMWQTEMKHIYPVRRVLIILDSMKRHDAARLKIKLNTENY